MKSAKPIKGKLTEFADTKETGLCLRVTPAGVKSWTYRYRLKSGEQRRMSLGKLRDVSLLAARALVVQHRASVAGGGDPAALAQLSRQDAREQRNRETVKDIGDWYFRECEAGRHRPNIKYPKRQSNSGQRDITSLHRNCCQRYCRAKARIGQKGNSKFDFLGSEWC